MPKPRCFVGSSTEGLEIARAVQEELDHDAEVTIWNQDVFRLSEIAVDSLVRALDATDFALLVLSADDVLKIRGEEHRAARDNVIFELGLAIGKLGRKRSFILAPRNTRDLRIPTDLLGINPATFDPDRSDKNLVAAVGPACAKVRRAITTLGPVQALRESQIEDPRALVLDGITRLQVLLSRSLGPAGTGVSLELDGRQTVTRSGLLICDNASVRDPFARQGVHIMARAAREMARVTGDGCKLAVLISARLIERAIAALETPLQRSEIVAGMVDAARTAQGALRVHAAPLSGKHVRQAASTAAMDSDLGAAIATAVERAGPEGIVTVESSTSQERVRITATEGMTFDRGFERQEFVTDGPANTALLQDCAILLFGGRVSGFREILPLLERVAQAKRPLLVIADRIEDEALATLVLNHQKGTLPCVAVRSPGQGATRASLLKDIAVYTGGTVVDPDLGMTLPRVTLDDLGRARLVRVSKDATTIIDGAGTPEDVTARGAQIRTEMEAYTDDYERARAQERLASLKGSIVTILLGGSTQAEVNEDRRRLIGGLNAVYAAIQSGWVVGGGVALVRAKAAIQSSAEADAARRLGMQIVERALEEPLRLLATSVGHDESATLAAVEQGVPEHVGLNVATRKLEDLKTAGILDARLTLERAIGVALTAARSVIETDSWSVDEDGTDTTSNSSTVTPSLGSL